VPSFNAPLPDRPVLARLVLPAEEPVSSHVVEFYETEEFLVDTVSGFIRTRFESLTVRVLTAL
jgi:hypothetical protein